MIFPLAGAILESMADNTPTTATPPGRVLVVDDEQPLAQMVASYLIRAGFDTRQAHTGTQAVDEARRFSPDVVVLDLGLPELDGLEAVSYTHLTLPTILRSCRSRWSPYH